MTRKVPQVEGDENYFVSMTDLMVGLLLIFIIMLMFFALQFKETIHLAEFANDARAKILEDIQRMLKEQGVQVHIDQDQGMLRLPESVLFESGHAELNQAGNFAISSLARSLTHVLPCYTYFAFRAEAECFDGSAMINAILIEGHTDTDPISSRRLFRDNLDLSAARATNTFRALLDASGEDQSSGQPLLLSFRNQSGVPVLGVSGYGEHRPISKMKDPNRRIDLRILMKATRSPARQGIEERVAITRETRTR